MSVAGLLYNLTGQILFTIAMLWIVSIVVSLSWLPSNLKEAPLNSSWLRFTRGVASILLAEMLLKKADLETMSTYPMLRGAHQSRLKSIAYSISLAGREFHDIRPRHNRRLYRFRRQRAGRSQSQRNRFEERHCRDNCLRRWQ